MGASFSEGFGAASSLEDMFLDEEGRLRGRLDGDDPLRPLRRGLGIVPLRTSTLRWVSGPVVREVDHGSGKLIAG